MAPFDMLHTCVTCVTCQFFTVTSILYRFRRVM